MTDDAPPKTYKIIEFRAENIKKLKVVRIRPDGAVIQITGDNGNGKTSLLDSIEWLFAGKRAITSAGQTNPIRTGEESALIKADLGDLIVTRTFTRKEDGSYDTTLKVHGADGARYSNEQAMMTALLGELSFDPIAFGRMPAADQFDAARALVPGIDFAAIAADQDKDFKERAEWNRKAKDRRSQAAGIVLPPGSIPKVADVAALEQQLADAATHNGDIETRKAGRLAAEERAKDAVLRAVQLRAQAEELLSQAAALDLSANETRKKLAEAPALPEPIDVTAVREQLATARVGNETAARAAQKDALEAEAVAAEAASKALTEAMDAREATKQRAIAKAKMPVAGLTFGDKDVLLNGEPFAQASKAEQWVASVSIAAALNPRLRVIRIVDGSLIGPANMKVLADLAEKLDLQIWVERLEASGGFGFELEDGHLKSDDTPPAPTPAPKTRKKAAATDAPNEEEAI